MCNDQLAFIIERAVAANSDPVGDRISFSRDGSNWQCYYSSYVNGVLRSRGSQGSTLVEAASNAIGIPTPDGKRKIKIFPKPANCTTPGGNAPPELGPLLLAEYEKIRIWYRLFPLPEFENITDSIYPKDWGEWIGWKYRPNFYFDFWDGEVLGNGEKSWRVLSDDDSYLTELARGVLELKGGPLYED